MNVIAKFEERVRICPDAPALGFKGETWSYEKLNNEVNNFASYVSRNGIGPGAFVGLCMKRSFEQIVAIIGIMKTGAAYIPIDPGYPNDRIRHIIADSGMKLLIIGDSVEISTSLQNIDVIRMPEIRNSQRNDPALNPEPHDDPGNLAYVIYTSGSTGAPKGAMITQRNLTWFHDTAVECFGYGSRDTWALIHSYGFDVSVWEIWGALAFGGRLVIIPEETLSDPEKLVSIVQEENITILSITPAAFYAYMNADRYSRNDNASSLRIIFVGGERLDFLRLRPWLEKYGEDIPRIYNMYGPTETTIYVTSKRVTLSDTLLQGPGSSIGHPLPGIRIILADGEGEPQIGNNPGEILIAGKGVGLGYLNQPGLTGEKFLTDGSQAGGYIYKSGDLGRLSENGEIEYLGRIDRQLKIRGHRVEPEEIESVLRQHPSILDAAVVPDIISADTVRLTGFVVPLGSHMIEESEVRGYLHYKLPAHMVCTRIISIPEMPLNAHGKVDRSAFIAPKTDPDSSTRNPTIVPRDEKEKLLSGIFSEITGSPSVGIRDNFFELGGNSLSAVRLAARIRDSFGIWLDIKTIFSSPTIETLLLSMENEKGSSRIPAYDFHRLDRNRDLPLTYSQERVWLIQHRNPHSVAYHFEVAISFYGDLQKDLLEKSLQGLVDRHEIYRTTFHFSEGTPVQRIHKNGTVICDYTDLSHCDRGEALQRIEAWRNDRVRSPLHMDHLPLIQWHLFRVSGIEHVLLHKEHHLLHDGWSFFIMMRDLLAMYKSYAAGKTASLPELPFQIADFADAQRRWVTTGGHEDQQAFWRETLAGCPEILTLPWDKPRPPRPSMEGGSVRFDLLPNLTSEIDRFGKSENTTSFMVMTAVFALLLGKYSGMKDICFGSGVANRRHSESEGMIGMIINNLVLRFKLPEQATFHEFLKQTRDIVLDALSNQDLPFDRMVDIPGMKSNESFSPVCQVLFSSYDGPLFEDDIPGLHVETELVLPINAAKFDLNVILIRQPLKNGEGARRKKITMIWEYSSDLFEISTIGQMSRHYLTMLQNVMEHPDTPVQGIGVFEPFETELLLSKSEGIIKQYPDSFSIAHVWGLQVQQSPDNEALVSGDRMWTYKELDDASTSFARQLIDCGVGPECVVGCCMPRGPDTIVTFLAILKTGGAYLPLNPKDPDERIGFLMHDSGSQILVTDNDLIQRFSHLADIKTILFGQFPKHTDNALACQVNRDALACILYTSGSTGVPKGVEVLHQGIIRLVCEPEFVNLGPHQRVLQLSSLSFDASSFEIWGALLNGGCLVIYPEDIPDLINLESEIRKQKITTMWLNASLFNNIIDARPGLLGTVRQLIIGGEALSTAHVKKAYALLPDIKIINGYGPTENTTFTCCYEIPRNIPESLVSIPLGRPISNTCVYILDADMNQVPPGVTGELYLGGDGVSRGYRGRPDLTRELFIHNPFAKAGNQTMYRSGDLGTWTKDYLVSFQGRRDRQLKIRGFRIEPAEIEAAISRIPGVLQCAVEATDNPSGERNLVAYIVMKEGFSIGNDEIKTALRKRLPEYLVPSRYMILDRLPLSETGKLSVKDLPSPVENPEGWPWLAFLKYRSRDEVIIRQVFEELLHVSDIGPDDDFFELGGHSLQLINLASKIYEIYGLQIDIPDLFPSPSVARVCNAIKIAEARSETGQHTEKSWPSSIVPVKKHGTKPPIFLVPGGTGDDFSLAMYARLAPYLPDDRPMYGFRTRDAEENWLVPHDSVEEMAASFVWSIREIQPDGPYNIAGGCIGGVIAFEVARQLRESGHQVERLILLESWPPDMTGYMRMVERNWCTRVRFMLEDNLLRGAPMGCFGKFVARTAPGLKRYMILKGPETYRWIQSVLPWHWEDIPNELRPEWSMFHKMVLRYKPKQFDGSLVLFESRTPYRLGASNAWQRCITGHVNVMYTEGNHLTYLTEHIKDTGLMFGALFDENDTRDDFPKPDTD